MSEPFRASCSACGVSFQVKNPALIGKKVRCPKCKQPTLIEAPAGAGFGRESSTNDPLGLGDLSSYGDMGTGTAPLSSQPFPGDPLTNSAFPNSAFPNSAFPAPSAPGTPTQPGTPTRPGAPSYAAAFPTAGGSGGAKPPGAAAVASPWSDRKGGSLPPPEDETSWWDSMSPRTKYRGIAGIVTIVLMITGSIVAFLGRTAGVGYVGLYANRQDKSLRELRAEFKTDLRGPGPAPNQSETGTLPSLWNYPSNDGLSLLGSLRFPEGDGKFPAVVFCHGGFRLAPQDVDVTDMLLKAGFAVYAPSWRGENGNPGNYELCYGEVADCVAAMEYLARREDIDPENIFLAGHSLGAINAMLAAELSSRPRGAVAIGGMLDMYGFHRWQPKPFIDEIPFDSTNETEDLLRSPAKFLADLACPVRLVYGDDDFEPARDQAKALAAAAPKLGKQVEYVEIKGTNHLTSLHPALEGSIAYFRDLMKQPRQSPAPVFEDRTSEWIAQQMANVQAADAKDRRPAPATLAAAWTMKPDAAPAQDFAPLFALAEQYGIGTPIIAGPRQWWSLSATDQDFVIRDLVNRTSHRVSGRRSLVDDRIVGGVSGFRELSPDGKSLLWRVESGGDDQNLPKQQLIVLNTQDLSVVRTIERAADGQFLAPDVVLVARATFTGNNRDFHAARGEFRLAHALRRVNVTTGEESAEIAVRAGGIWALSPGRNLLVIAHPTESEEARLAKSKETFQGHPGAMELTVVDFATWSVAVRGEYGGVPTGRALAWSSDGKLLASVSAEGAVGLWDFMTGQAAILTGLGKVSTRGVPTVRFLDADQLLLINGAHLVNVADGRKIGELQPAAGAELESTQWIGDRYRPRTGGAFLPFPFEQLHADLRQVTDPSSNLLADRKVELTVEAQSGEQIAADVLGFVREQLKTVLKRRFDLSVVEPDGMPHVQAKVRYGETVEWYRAQPGSAGPKSHDYEPLNRGGKQQCRLTFELATPDGRVVHSDNVKAEAMVSSVELSASKDAQLRTAGLLLACEKLAAKLPIAVPRDAGQETWPKKLALSAGAPATVAWDFPETTGKISTAGAATSPDTTNLPARRTVRVEDRRSLKSSRYVLGIPTVDGQPTLVVHGVRGDTQWIRLDDQAGENGTTSLGEVLPTFSPAGDWLATRALTALGLRSIRPGATLSEPKVFKFPSNIMALAWSPSGRLLAAGVAPGAVEVYDTEKLRTAATLADVSPIAKFTTNGLVVDLSFSADEQRIVACEGDRSLAAFDLTNGMPLGRFSLQSSQLTRGASPTGIGTAFSTDGRRVFGLSGGELVAFDLATGKKDGQWPAPGATALIPSPDGRWLAILQSNLSAQLRRASAPDDWRSLRLETKNRVVTTSADMKGAWSGDGRIFAATDQVGTTTVWDVEP